MLRKLRSITSARTLATRKRLTLFPQGHEVRFSPNDHHPVAKRPDRAASSGAPAASRCRVMTSRSPWRTKTRSRCDGSPSRRITGSWICCWPAPRALRFRRGRPTTPRPRRCELPRRSERLPRAGQAQAGCAGHRLVREIRVLLSQPAGGCLWGRAAVLLLLPRGVPRRRTVEGAVKEGLVPAGLSLAKPRS